MLDKLQLQEQIIDDELQLLEQRRLALMLKRNEVGNVISMIALNQQFPDDEEANKDLRTLYQRAYKLI